MKAWMRSVCLLACPLILATFCSGTGPAAKDIDAPITTPIYVAVNQDIALPTPNSVGFLQASGTQLINENDVSTGGYGIQGGFFGTQRVSSVASLTAPCLYVSDAGTNDIAAVSLPGQQLMGTYSASATDDGSANGIGLAVNSHYLYASFTASNTIATFSLQGNCGLTFLGDVTATGLQGGSVVGMAVSGNILVVAYGDGSIQSFNVTNGMPVSNADLQNSSGYGGSIGFGSVISGNMPSGVDITQNGKFAIFGDIGASTVVEVSSLATGKLARTAVYSLGPGIDAGAIRLSPDQKLLYMANSEGGTVTAAFFNATTGAVTKGCTSPTLSGFNSRPWLGSVATRDTSGSGNVLYVAEFGRDYLEVNHGPSSAIGILNITSNGTTCTLTEASGSPQLLTFPGSLSLGVYPPRPF
jgi:6-phosphogluconolactonase (cycloisomerase 2 family)